jgi:hypothetical protein
MNDQRRRARLQLTTTIAEQRSCFKIRHPSKRVAWAHARRLGINAYKCPVCRRWHTGHSRRRAAA